MVKLHFTGKQGHLCICKFRKSMKLTSSGSVTQPKNMNQARYPGTLIRNISLRTSTDRDFRVVASQDLEQRLSAKPSPVIPMALQSIVIRQADNSKMVIGTPFVASFRKDGYFFHLKKTSFLVSLRVVVRLNSFIIPRVFRLNPFDDVLLSR